MTWFKGCRLGALAITAGLLLALAGFAQAETISWNVDADGSWQDASNWDLGRVPRAGDDVVIDRSAGDYTITYYDPTNVKLGLNSLACAETFYLKYGQVALAADSSIPGALTLSGRIEHAATLTVDGLFTWSGILAGAGRTVARGGIHMTAGVQVHLRDGHVLENEAMAVVESQSINGYDGAIIRNLATGTMVMRNSDPDVVQRFWAGDAILANAGTFRKEGRGESRIHFTFDHDGTVEVRDGHLKIESGGTGTGSFSGATGTTLSFGNISASSDLVFTAGSIDTNGDVVFERGSARISGPFRVAGETEVHGWIEIDGGSTGRLDLHGGVLACTGDLTVSGPLTWTVGGGTLTGPGRTIAEGGLEIGGTGVKALEGGHTLENRGTAIWSTTATIYGKDGAVLRNAAGATFVCQVETGAEQGFGAEARRATFENAGTLRKEGAGRTSITAPFVHEGTAEVLDGTLALAGGSGNGGFAAAVGTRLEIGYTDSGQDSSFGAIDSDGDVKLGPAGNVTIGGSFRVAGMTEATGHYYTLAVPAGATTGSLTMSAGSLYCPGEFTISELFVWQRGRLTGEGTTHAQGGIEFRTGGHKYVMKDRVLDNHGVADWKDPGSCFIDIGAVFNNLPGSTLLFRSEEGQSEGLVVDGEGNAVVVGSTFSEDFPQVRGLPSPSPGFRARGFVTRFDAEGRCVYSTYLGGGAHTVAVDADGRVWVGGASDPEGFPLVHPAHPDLSDVGGAFVAKLNPAGEILTSTFLVGPDSKVLHVALDGRGLAYVAGTSTKTPYPGSDGALQPRWAGGFRDAFVAILDAEDLRLLRFTWLGGQGDEGLGPPALDGAGRILLAGHTSSRDFPTTEDAHQREYGGGVHDGFFAILSGDLSKLLYSTFLGGSLEDGLGGITLGRNGEVWIAGGSQSEDFPMVDPAQPELGGDYDAVLLRFEGAATPDMPTVDPDAFAEARADAARADPPLILVPPSSRLDLRDCCSRED